MRYVLALLVAGIVVYLVLRDRASSGRATPVHVIDIDDVPNLVGQLQRSGTDGSFAGLIFSDPSRPNDEPVNLQFSMEGGRVGFDWLLVQQPNIEDQNRFIELTTQRGQPHRALSANGVSYLRVENGDLAGLAVAVMQDLYRVPSEQRIELIAEGFEWPVSHRN